MKISDIKTRTDVFDIIADAKHYGNLGLFIGAGTTMAILNEDQDIALGWGALIEKCCSSLGIDYSTLNLAGLSYPEVSTLICKSYSKLKSFSYRKAVSEFKNEIANQTAWYPEQLKKNEYSVYFNSLDPKWIITTNYDTVIEAVLTGKGYSLSPNEFMVARKGMIPVYHLHGHRLTPDTIIITQEDYVTLFRPNEYRQQKLAQTIKESLTVLMGYNLGDFNVMTAVDWCNNVYPNEIPQHPQGIIQFLRKHNPNKRPYLDEEKGVVILEFDELGSLLKELSEWIYKKTEIYERVTKEIEEVNNELINANEEFIVLFIDNQKFRLELMEMVKEDNFYTINGFLEVFSRSMDMAWHRTNVSGAFDAYANYLNVLLDVIMNIELKIMPPALLEAIVYRMSQVAPYIGNNFGESYAANKMWNSRKPDIPLIIFTEMLNIARTRRYRILLNLLR